MIQKILIKNQEENIDIPWSEIISFRNKQEISERMWAGIDNLGIVAVNNTHLVKAQIAGLQLQNGMQIRVAVSYIHADGFQNSDFISLSGIFDMRGGNIKDTFSELLNASADVSNDPF